MFQIILTYFLWNSVFADTNTEVFGYNREKILTYVFGIIIIRALVFSARSVDIPGEIADGKLSNYLIRPINYFKYWLTRDLSSKALNLAFSISEFIILAIILKPPLFFQSNLYSQRVSTRYPITEEVVKENIICQPSGKIEYVGEVYGNDGYVYQVCEGKIYREKAGYGDGLYGGCDTKSGEDAETLDWVESGSFEKAMVGVVK